MVTAVRKNTTSIASYLFDNIYEFEFPQAVKLLNLLHPHRSSPATIDNPKQESVCFSSHITFAVSSSDLHSLKPSTPPILTVNFLGIAGIQGPLPDVFTEIFIDRLKIKDTAARDFLDIFNHRLISLWYKQTTSIHPCLTNISLKQSSVGKCLIDLAGAQYHDDPSIFLSLSSLYWQKIPSSIGLQKILTTYFNYPVRISGCKGRWHTISMEERSVLGKKYHQLGENIVLGKKSFCQFDGFIIEIGPLDYNDFQGFLPTTNRESPFQRLKSLVDAYFSLPPYYTLKLIIHQQSIPQCTLNGTFQLNRNAWLLSHDFKKNEEHITISYDLIAHTKIQ